MLCKIHKKHRSQIHATEESLHELCSELLVYHIILTGNRISYTFMVI